MSSSRYSVAVVGAGPAGLYAAKQLVNAGAHVTLLNRDIKPGGLAEYGIYPDKYKMKDGLRAQFRQILALPDVDYYGNVSVGQAGDLTLADLLSLGFQAVLITVGAQGTKWLGLPGEELRGVYHAKDCVYHYNRLPPFGQRPFEIGQHVAVVGGGNVMMDIAHWLVRELKVQEVIAVIRRGPAEVKFDKREFEVVSANLDLAALDAEVARVAPLMEAVGQNPDEAKAGILAALPRALPRVSDTLLRFEFLASPVRILGDNASRVCGLVVDENKLERTNGDTRPRRLGTQRVLNVDSVIFAIGDRVDETFGLAVQGYEFAKNPNPRFPVDGVSYEALDPGTGSAIPGVFLAGWARLASVGLVGVARKDGERGARAVVDYLHTLSPEDTNPVERFQERLKQIGRPVVTKKELSRLAELERAEAAERGVQEWKYVSNEEMLAALGMEPEALPA